MRAARPHGLDKGDKKLARKRDLEIKGWRRSKKESLFAD
jgi:predicted GIY-YIG superfamily endonuclease